MFPDNEVEYLPQWSIINLIPLLSAGLFTVLWPLLRIASSDFPDTCSQTGFILATLAGFVHLIYSVFLIVWLGLRFLSMIEKQDVSAWMIGSIAHAILSFICGIIGIVSIFAIMENSCIDSNLAKWSLFVVYLLFILGALGFYGLVTWTFGKDPEDGGWFDASACEFCLIIPVAQLCSPLCIFIGVVLAYDKATEEP